MEKEEFIQHASSIQSLTTQNSNGEVMVVPAAYIRAVILQSIDRNINNAAKLSRGELK